jgi:hypothetical protein
MLKMKTIAAYIIVIAICLATATVFAGQAIIVPGEFASAEATATDNAPLGAISTQQIFQQVFSPALLTNLSTGEEN